MEERLEDILNRLNDLTDLTCARWVQEQRAEDDEFTFHADSDPFWLALEVEIGGWKCGYKVQPDEMVLWAVDAVGATPRAAALALLAKVTSPGDKRYPGEPGYEKWKREQF